MKIEDKENASKHNSETIMKENSEEHQCVTLKGKNFLKKCQFATVTLSEQT
jgi:hypothetical protein